LLPKIISIDIIFCGLQKQFTTKATKGSQKQEMRILSYIIVYIFKETKAKFLFHKNFCVFFVPFVVLYFD